MSKNVVALAPALDDDRLISVLQGSLYPGAAPESVRMVLGYCRAAGLDPMLKPVHIVPLWDRTIGGMRDVVMPGIGLYRTQAARTGEHAGTTEPEFGPDVEATIGGQQITYPSWCKVTVKRLLASGLIAEHTAVERWIENYAVKGGKEKSIAPNAMWTRRAYGQLAKCAQAQALRLAFPELGAAPTAEEMEGKPLDPNTIDATFKEAVDPWTDELRATGATASNMGTTAYGIWWKSCAMEFRKAAVGSTQHADFKARAETVNPQHAPIEVDADGVILN